jgi:hypothetical protein
MARKKAKRYDDGGEIVVSGSRAEDARVLDRMMREPSFVGGGGDFGGGSLGDRFGGDSGGGGGAANPKMSVGKVRTPVGKVFGLRDIPVGKGSFSVGASPTDGGKVGGTFKTSFKKGGKVKKMAKGGSTASKRGDGIATKGKTKGRFI